MQDPSNSVRLHRVLRAPAERVYKAFLDPDALCRWLPPYGYLGKMHAFDGKVGGGYRMSFINFATGFTHTFNSNYAELAPNERVCMSDTFEDPDLPGEMHKSITLRPVSCGTELTIIHEGLPPAIPAEMCYLGWQESLLQLANLVEEIAHDS